MGTATDLMPDKIKHQLEANMDEWLSKKCSASKLDAVNKFKEWTTVVHQLDEEIREELKTFEVITLKTRNKQCG